MAAVNAAVAELLEHLAQRPATREVILSGGGPMTLPLEALARILEPLAAHPQVNSISVRTKTIAFAPKVFDDAAKRALLAAAGVRLVFHFAHPDEPCDAVRATIARLRGDGIRCYNQFVLLRNVNDHADLLIEHLTLLDDLQVRNLSVFLPEPIIGSAPFRMTFARFERIADTLDDGSPLVGASTAGPTPFLTNATAATLSLGGRNDLWFLQPSDWTEASAFQSGLRRLGAERSGMADLIGQSYEQLLELAAELPTDGDDDIDWDQPMLAEGGDLGQQLHLAADLIDADLGMRVVYTSIGGFDTHDDHEWQHPQLMAQVDAAIDGFLGRVDDAGRSDDVLVATISEFGRRVPENGRGLDHGSASTMLLAGAVDAGRYGEAPSIDDLDDDDNLRVTTPFDRYLGTLAQTWLGVEAASVLPSAPELLALGI